MRDHRSLEAWKEARQVTLTAIRFSRSHWKPYASAVFDQLQRAALSVQLNIAEGYALFSKKRMANHLTVAYGSAVETADLLTLGIEEDLMPAELAGEALNRAKRCQALLLGLIRRTRE